MGSMIPLGVGRMEIDWGKNNVFRNHSSLFKTEDIKSIPYYYVDEDGTPITELNEGYSRKLSSIKRRLDLLGYTIQSIEKLYNQTLNECSEFGLTFDLSFNDFATLLKEINVERINTPKYAVEYDENGYDFGEFVRRCIFPEKEIYSRLLATSGGDKRKLDYHLEDFFENIDPYIILRLLAENPSCTELDVYWSFFDVLEGGWAKREDIIKPLSNREKILIVTEGSSDSFIIKRAIDTLYPDISDFFQFIDMQENYPFTGIGNLYNFCCGLMKIGVNNNIIVIFDNDTAGNEIYDKMMKLPQLENLLITKLPECSLFEKIDTLGPQGHSIGDINGTGVAIECFLDFASCDICPTVRWTNYVDKVHKYQGSLLKKDDYVRAFKKADLLSGTYDTAKLKMLIDYLLNQWCTYHSR